jgi:hypothetical protein
VGFAWRSVFCVVQVSVAGGVFYRGEVQDTSEYSRWLAVELQILISQIVGGCSVIS